MTRLAAALALMLLASTAPAGAQEIEAGCYRNPELEVIDGDNVRFQGQNVRLLGYDAPEVDERAECLREDFLASVARATLRVLVEGNETILCLTGSTCGFERPCGFLAVQRSGRWLDVGAILMTPTDRYGVLAVPYVGEQGDWCD